MRTYDTTKLFYDQYVYKLVFTNGLSSIFRNKNLTYARKILDRLDSAEQAGKPLAVQRMRRVEPVSVTNFVDAKKLIRLLYNFEDYTLRIELSKMSIYANSKEWLTTIKHSVDPNCVLEFWEPSPLQIDKLKPNVLISDSYPGYEYKVTILLESCERKSYVDGFYFFVRDEKTLGLINLFLSNIRRIDKIVAM